MFTVLLCSQELQPVSFQAINRQKPMTLLIKFKTSSCQMLCLALPFIGPNGYLCSKTPLCQILDVSFGE